MKIHPSIAATITAGVAMIATALLWPSTWLYPLAALWFALAVLAVRQARS